MALLIRPLSRLARSLETPLVAHRPQIPFHYRPSKRTRRFACWETAFYSIGKGFRSATLQRPDSTPLPLSLAPRLGPSVEPALLTLPSRFALYYLLRIATGITAEACAPLLPQAVAFCSYAAFCLLKESAFARQREAF